MGELRKPKQGELSTERHTDKYYSLLQKGYMGDPGLFYQRTIAGLSAGEWQAVTGWATDKELQGEPVPLEAMMKFLRIKAKKKANAFALADQVGTTVGEESDVQPMDIATATAGPVPT